MSILLVSTLTFAVCFINPNAISMIYAISGPLIAMILFIMPTLSTYLIPALKPYRSVGNFITLVVSLTAYTYPLHTMKARMAMSSVKLSGTATLGDRQVYRLGYGAMQLAGPGVFGPPKDPQTAIRVLQEAVESGVNHIDTSDFYGPHITNQLIRQALHPYPDAPAGTIKATGYPPCRPRNSLRR